MACNIAKCRFDLNDCVHYRTVCGPHFCPHDGKCRPNCEIEGCTKNTCDLADGNFKIHAIVTASINPVDLFKKFERIEHILNRRTKINIVFQAQESGPLIWGFKTGSHVSEPLHMNRTGLGPYIDLDREQYQKRSIAILLLDSPHIVTYENEKTMEELRCLGLKKVHGQVGLYPFARKDLVGYSPDYIDDYRTQQRAQREQKEKERRTRRLPPRKATRKKSTNG